MPKITLSDKEQKKRSAKIKFLFSKAMSSQVSSRTSALVTDSYLDLFVKSVQSATWSQDGACFYVSLIEDSESLFDLRTKAVEQIVKIFKQNFKNTVVVDRYSFTIYK